MQEMRLLCHGHGSSLLFPEQLCWPQQFEALPLVPRLDAAGIIVCHHLCTVAGLQKMARDFGPPSVARLWSGVAALGQAVLLYCDCCSWMDANVCILADNSNCSSSWSICTAKVTVVFAVGWQDLHQLLET